MREERTNQGIAQETLAHMAGIERSHMGKIERGEHVPTLPLILKIARALKCSSAHLMTLTEAGQLGFGQNHLVGGTTFLHTCNPEDEKKRGGIPASLDHTQVRPFVPGHLV